MIGSSLFRFHFFRFGHRPFGRARRLAVRCCLHNGQGMAQFRAAVRFSRTREAV